ncbi:hypothetical protein HT031_002645 [Scenedesmus sp. PABB004]|nr:hypothetical protein HT031_002645 [Scenedesmus sp. PABB004]
MQLHSASGAQALPLPRRPACAPPLRAAAVQAQAQEQPPADAAAWRERAAGARRAARRGGQAARGDAARPVIAASLALLPGFGLADFRSLLRLCAAARYVPDAEALAAAFYSDTGGLERLLPAAAEAAPREAAHLLADLGAVLASPTALALEAQRQLALLQLQQQQLPGSGAAAELAALQAALETATHHVAAIRQHRLLAGELSAMGGYWLLRRLLPRLAGGGPAQRGAAARGFGALAADRLGYRVLDPEDADLLVRLLAQHLPAWRAGELAAALSAALPCLGGVPPSRGDDLALLFAAAGAAAGGMQPREAARLLLVLCQLPGYAPDPKVAQALLDAALAPPLAGNARSLYGLLSAAAELGAAPRPEQLLRVQGVLQGQR